MDCSGGFGSLDCSLLYLWRESSDKIVDLSMLAYLCDYLQWKGEYITEKGGEKYLNTLYFKWDSVDQIDWSIVPSKCIIKTNTTGKESMISVNPIES